VLHDFAKADQAWLEPLLDAVADGFPLLATGDDAGFMNKVATLTAPPQTKTAKPKKDTPAGDTDITTKTPG